MIQGTIRPYILGLLTSGGGVIQHKDGSSAFYVQSNDKKQIQALATDIRKNYNTRVAWEEDKTVGRKQLYRILVNAVELAPYLSAWPRRPGPTSHWQVFNDPHDTKTYVRGVFEARGGNVSVSSRTVIAKGQRNPLKGRQVTLVFTTESEGVALGMEHVMRTLGAPPFHGLRQKGKSNLHFLRLANEQAIKFMAYMYGDTPRYYTYARMRVYKILTTAKDRRILRSVDRPQVSVVTMKGD